MSYPVAFEQPPKPELDAIGRTLANPPLNSEDIQQYSKEQQQTTEKQPEGNAIPKKAPNSPLNGAEMKRKQMAKGKAENDDEEDGGDRFPLAKDEVDPEQLQCEHCGNTKCKWCEEKAPNISEDINEDDAEEEEK